MKVLDEDQKERCTISEGCKPLYQASEAVVFLPINSQRSLEMVGGLMGLSVLVLQNRDVLKVLDFTRYIDK